MVTPQLIEIFTQLQFPESRQAGLRALTHYAGATEAMLFGKDPEINIYLPAQGLPQTIQHGRKWQAFISKSVQHSPLAGKLPSQLNNSEQIAYAIVDKFGLAVIILLGAELPKEVADDIAALLPLIGAKLIVERTAMSAFGHAAAARDANRHASSLNAALDANRRELQKAFERVEQELISRREAEKKLREADRRKDEFLAMLAHELRNPLAPINMAAHILRVLCDGKSQIVKASEIIERQVKHMTSLLDDLLDVSRVTRRLIVLAEDILDLRSVVSDALEQTRPLIEARKHQITVHLSPDPIMVKGDRTRLVQIIANLLNNAAKYTPPKGELLLKLEMGAEDIELTVRDNGIGIDEMLLPHVFDLFTQAERSSDRSQGGLGVGLALVKTLVELHGGTVMASSHGPGKGSEFVVRLPGLERSKIQTQDEEQEAGSQEQAQENGLSILIVDDNVDAADSLTVFFETLGYKVRAAYHAREAIELARAEMPAVLILDIGLPDMNGLELAKVFRQMPQTANAVLIALTGYGQQEDRENALDAGFDHHFVKPIEITKLAELLRQCGRS